MNLIIDSFPRLKYFAVQILIEISLESGIKQILFKTNEEKNFHPLIFSTQVEAVRQHPVVFFAFW